MRYRPLTAIYVTMTSLYANSLTLYIVTVSVSLLLSVAFISLVLVAFDHGLLHRKGSTLDLH